MRGGKGSRLFRLVSWPRHRQPRIVLLDPRFAVPARVEKLHDVREIFGRNVAGEGRHVRTAVDDAQGQLVFGQRAADVGEIRPSAAAVLGDEVAADASFLVKDAGAVCHGARRRADDFRRERRSGEVRRPGSSGTLDPERSDHHHAKHHDGHGPGASPEAAFASIRDERSAEEMTPTRRAGRR